MIPRYSASAIIFLVLSALPLMTIAEAACTHPVDPSRAVIFAGLNEAFIERKAAEEAACLRGESFYSLPKPLPDEDAAVNAFITMSHISQKLATLADQSSLKNCKKDAAPGTPCGVIEERVKALEAAQVAASQIYTPFWKKFLDANRSRGILGDYKLLLSDLASRNIRPTAIILSGHSTGHGVWGYIGTLEFTDIRAALSSAYTGNKNLLSELQQIFLWGCNTINPYNGGAAWIKSFPELKMIFGFQGSAPGSKNAASPALLKSGLLAEPSLNAALKLKQPDVAIKSVFDSLRGIEYSLGAVYINDSLKNRGFYYERVKSVVKNAQGESTENWTSEVKPVMSEAQCEHIRPELNADQQMTTDLFDGKIEIPRDTAGGSLRDLYTRARRNEVCRKLLNLKYSADQIGYLLFWHDLKKNAARFIGNKASFYIDAIRSYLTDSRIRNAVAAANQNGNSEKAKLIAEHQKKISGFEEQLDAVTLTYQAYQDSAETMPWRRKNERRLRHLARAIKKLERASDMNQDTQSDSQRSTARSAELTALRRNYNVLIDLKSISNSDFEKELKRIYNGLTVQKETLLREKSGAEEALKRTESTDYSELTAEVAKQSLRDLLDAMPPLTAEGVEPLSYSELKSRILAAEKKASDTRIVFSTIPSMGTLRDALNIVISHLSGYKALAINLSTECLNFQTWHEYSEDPGVPLPLSRCY